MFSQANEEQAKIITGCLIILATVALGAALLYTRAVMIPFVLAVFVTYMTSPLVDILQVRLKMPRIISVTIALLVICAGLYVLGSFFLLSGKSMLDNQDLYQDRLVAMIDKTAKWAASLQFDIKQEEIAEQIKGTVRELPITSWLKSAASQAMNIITKGGLVLVFAVFLLLGRNPHRSRTGLYGEIDEKVRKYLLTKVGLSAVTGILVGLILYGMGLDLALVFGVLTFLLNFIPSLGSIVATFLPLPIAFIQYESVLPVILVLVLPGGVQMFVGSFLDPKILGRSLSLHPVVVILSLVFWGLLWGPAGMILAVPMMAVLRIILGRFETTRPIAGVMIGQLPELKTDAERDTPPESTTATEQEDQPQNDEEETDQAKASGYTSTPRER